MSEMGAEESLSSAESRQAASRGASLWCPPSHRPHWSETGGHHASYRALARLFLSTFRTLMSSTKLLATYVLSDPTMRRKCAETGVLILKL